MATTNDLDEFFAMLEDQDVDFADGNDQENVNRICPAKATCDE